MSYEALPGGELIGPGLADYASGRVTEAALLVSIVRPRLLVHGLAREARSATLEDSNAKLYALVAARTGDGAHSAYNALIRRATSFCAALDASG